MNAMPTWLSEEGLQQLFTAVQKAGGEVRVVGGAVRDFLMDCEVGDIDFATTLLPQAMMEVAAAAGWKAIPTGIDHGTVTLVLPGRVVEVTTLRQDIATNGRHAAVAYTDDWQEDAARRDFTINALYMDHTGQLYDYFRGREDLAARRLTFIGDAGQRIEEDGLRILRYFRFLAALGWHADEGALAAITAKKDLVMKLSGERIQHEMKKLLRSMNPSHALEKMATCGIAPLVSNAEWTFERLGILLQLELQHQLSPTPFTRLFALIAPSQRPAVATWLVGRWKLSRQCQAAVAYFSAPMDMTLNTAIVKEWLRQGGDRTLVIGRLLLMAVDAKEVASYNMLLELAQEWEVPIFPVTAKDLLALGMQEGPALGNALRALEQLWVISGYTLTKDALLVTSRA